MLLCVREGQQRKREEPRDFYSCTSKEIKVQLLFGTRVAYFACATCSPSSASQCVPTLVSDKNMFGLIMRVSTGVYNVIYLVGTGQQLKLDKIGQDQLLCKSPSILFSPSLHARRERLFDVKHNIGKREPLMKIFL